ncbi:MAG TPA: LEA type 2 family protein [Casimicrobiaceae bacterium]|jgi:LEA14-like dessication related protein|nr:LEA type 2 family protein [Casimicrobiaceae bacterium]
MARACEHGCGVARGGWSKPFALPALLALFLGAACTSTPTKPDPPVVTLESARILRVADARADVVLVLRLTNPNRFDLVVNAIEYEITLDSRPAATGRSVHIDPLPAGGDARVELAGRVDVAALATALMTLGSQLPVAYTFKGSVTLRDGSVLAFSRKGEIPVARFDRLMGSRPQ